jgi:hypothetical protein
MLNELVEMRVVEPQNQEIAAGGVERTLLHSHKNVLQGRWVFPCISALILEGVMGKPPSRLSQLANSPQLSNRNVFLSSLVEDEAVERGFFSHTILPLM